MTTMLYKFPGPHEIHGGKYDYVIVEDDAIEQTLDAGWFLTTPEAKAATEAPKAPIVEPADNTPPNRAELEQKAAELSIKADGRWSDQRLSAEIEKVMGA